MGTAAGQWDRRAGPVSGCRKVSCQTPRAPCRRVVPAGSQHPCSTEPQCGPRPRCQPGVGQGLQQWTEEWPQLASPASPEEERTQQLPRKAASVRAVRHFACSQQINSPASPSHLRPDAELSEIAGASAGVAGTGCPALPSADQGTEAGEPFSCAEPQTRPLVALLRWASSLQTFFTAELALQVTAHPSA